MSLHDRSGHDRPPQHRSPYDGPLDAQPPGVGHPPLVLASGSRYRAEVLAQEGITVEVDPPDVDERALDPLLDQFGPDVLAVRLAELKARAVAHRNTNRWVVAADQVAVLAGSDGLRMLTKQPDEDSAVEQLVAMSGTVHHLVGGLVILDADTGRILSGVDVHRVRMRAFTEIEARGYVQRFEPYDTAGTYRIEDAEEMEPGESLVEHVSGESPSGVLGMPVPLMRRLLGRARVEWLSTQMPTETP